MVNTTRTQYGQKQNPAICGAFKGALGRTRTCDLLIRSQDTCVCSCLWLFKNRLSKLTSRSGCSQLFTWVTVKSLSTIVASNDQPAAFRCGEGSSSRNLIIGTQIHWKPGFREEPFSSAR